MSTNIFQIWDKIGRKTPFAVRRDNWSEGYYTVVTEVECDKMPYGKAYGYPTNNGIYSNHYEYDKDWRNYKLIPCGGCYQWHLIENADLESYKRGLEATKKTVISGQTINSKVYFGKYKGQTIDEISNNNPGYIEWAINNIDDFLLTPETFEYLDKLSPSFRFSDAAKSENARKVSLKTE